MSSLVTCTKDATGGAVDSLERVVLTSTDTHRPGVTSFVHVGLVVEDLDETVRFLTVLGFDCSEPAMFSGEWIGRIIGLEDVTVELVMARSPDGTDMFEVVRFHSPSAGAQEPAPAVNRPGLRHIAFRVDDVRGVVDRVERPAGKRSGRSSTSRACSCSATSAGLKA